MRIGIPQTTLTIAVPAGRQAISLDAGLVLAEAGEDTEWIGKAGYCPTNRGAFSVFRHPSASSTPREAADESCARIPGHPDILESDLGPRSVEFEWTDGVRLYRTWILAIADTILELDYVTKFDSDAALTPADVGEIAKTLVATIQGLSD